MNQHEKCISIVTKIESEFDVNSLTCNEILLWPLVRLELVNIIMNGVKTPLAPKIHSISGLEEKNGLNYKAFNKYLQNMKPMNEGLDFLLISNENSTNEITIGKKSYMKFIDSFYDIYSNYFTIEHITIKNNKKTFQHDTHVQYIDFLNEVVRIESLLFFAKKKYNIENIEKLIPYLKESGIDLNQSYIEYRVSQLFSFINCFKSILEIFKPKAIPLVCFYSIYHMAICHAAKELEIDTLELQHGVQNDFHYMYTHWTIVPKVGYSLIPNYFMMWDDISKNRIEKWSKKTCYHRAIIFGNVFLYNLKNIPKQTQLINQHYPKDHINILVTLQVEKYYNRSLTKVINKLTEIDGKKIVWHFKNHPIFEKDLFVKKIKPKVSKNILFEYEYTNQHTIYDILDHIDINITAFSSTAKELKQLSLVPTIFTSTLGLRENGFFHCYTAISILKKIQYIIRYQQCIKQEMKKSIKIQIVGNSIQILRGVLENKSWNFS